MMPGRRRAFSGNVTRSRTSKPTASANHGIAPAAYKRPTPTSYACRTMNSTSALPCLRRRYVDRIASPRSTAASPYSSSTATPMTTRPYSSTTRVRFPPAGSSPSSDAVHGILHGARRGA